MTSSAVFTQPLGSLVDRGYEPREPASEDEVWSLNLDQIEPHTGRVLSRCMLSASELGPSTYAFDRGTVLYSKLRPYLNKVVVADDNGVATTELVPLRCDESRLDAKYLAHFLRGPDFLRFATNVVAGAKMPRMVMSEFWKFPVPLPPLPEQRRISAILDQADALRAKRREALAQLDSLTQSIFIEMFGDPKVNSMQWPQPCMGELIDSGPQNGLYKPSTDYGSGSPILRIDAFYDGAVTKVATLKRVRVSADELRVFGLAADDVVINRVNSIEYLGKSALIPALQEPTVFESNMMRFKLASKRVLPRYLVAFLQTPFVKEQIRAASKDAVNQSSINQQDVKGFRISVPPMALQQTFAARIQAIEALKTTHCAALAELDALFASLQHRAFSGGL